MRKDEQLNQRRTIFLFLRKNGNTEKAFHCFLFLLAFGLLPWLLGFQDNASANQRGLQRKINFLNFII